MAELASTLITRARYELKDTASENYSDAEFIVYLNMAVRAITHRIAEMWPDYWLRTGETYTATTNIVAATTHYDLPTDFFVEIQVRCTDGDGKTDILRRISWERAQDSDADGYVLKNDDIYLYPAARYAASVASGLVIDYVAIPADITVASGSVPLSTRFEDLIVEYVVLKAKARQEENPDAFGAFFRRMERSLDAMMVTINRSDADAGLRIPWRNWT